jgi:hypothetical protein
MQPLIAPVAPCQQQPSPGQPSITSTESSGKVSYFAKGWHEGGDHGHADRFAC